MLLPNDATRLSARVALVSRLAGITGSAATRSARTSSQPEISASAISPKISKEVQLNTRPPQVHTSNTATTITVLHTTPRQSMAGRAPACARRDSP